MAKSHPAETPMMNQYSRLKRRHPDAILFFRMGDFYETFGDDAKVASSILGIALTSRGKGPDASPLAGVPHHSADSYVARLVRAGKKVAICEQIEDPAKATGLVKRDVVQVVTAGTVSNPTLLDDRRNNYLMALAPGKDGRVGVSLLDVSTGEFNTAEVSSSSWIAEALRSSPREILLPESWRDEAERGAREGGLADVALSPADDWLFGYDRCYRALTEHFHTQTLEGFGCENLKAGVSAAGAALTYVAQHHMSSLDHVSRLVHRQSEEALVLDEVTLRNLEILDPLPRGDARGTLLAVVDRTLTPMGGRLLRQWLARPLRKVEEIRERLASVRMLLDDKDLRHILRELLEVLPDLERLAARVSFERANPRDLVAVKQSLKTIPLVKNTLGDCEATLVAGMAEELVSLPETVSLLEKALVDAPPMSWKDGGLIRPGYDSELDELREIASHGKSWVAKLQSSERERTGIPTLKVGYNKVFGYYIEVTKPHIKQVPGEYERKQTLVSAERFVTPELKEWEEKILTADERRCRLEEELFVRVRSEVAEERKALLEDARLLAVIDVIAALAEVAETDDFREPTVEESARVLIRDGRHAVVEALLPTGDFVPNDTLLEPESRQILIVTGPNMAGKSTYLRQVGLIVILAQMGSFVPASEANIGVADRIFTRIGATDSLVKGQSTFLVEMQETARILHHATPRSLVLLDEIGRGTSTYDGMSIAWAVAEFLHDHREAAARTLFATHYHELTQLARSHPRIHNLNVQVREWKDEIVFLRKIVDGATDRSYGIQVARLAGLPSAVVARAKEVLEALESEDTRATGETIRRGSPEHAQHEGLQMSLFAPDEHPALDELRGVDIEKTTPVEALTLLVRLKKLAEGKE